MSETFEITKKYREQNQLSLRAFAEEINAKLVNTSVTHQTVSLWEREKHYYEPDMRLLFECVATYQDWRAKWAVECLKSMFPDLFDRHVIVIKLPQVG